MSEENTNWGQSVTGVVIKEGKVLLARHTYGNGKGMLIVPGGYVKYNETPQAALKREYLEETGIEVEPKDIIGIRFNYKDWYVAFRADFIAGEAHSDGDENDEVVWLDVEAALQREDVPDLTKKLIESAVYGKKGLVDIPFNGSFKNGPYSFYGVGGSQHGRSL
ncbi:MAG: NUDIX domain-containing protein [Firmicutes bacterium]|nr:NUDIX domain-containing protein [Bacillota bacterium]